MAEKPKGVEPKWHESVNDYVDFSDKKAHILHFEDDGELVKIPGSKSDLNVSFRVNEWNPEEEAWEPNIATFSSMRALRIAKAIQEEGSLKDRFFSIQRVGDGMETTYEWKELDENRQPLA